MRVEEKEAAVPTVAPGERPLPFIGPWLLAPMEGVTEPCFRDLVLKRNPGGALGGAFTEFARVVDYPLPKKTLLRHLGPERFEAPVGLQLMGNDLAALAETAGRAEECGAPIVDLNFGCPAKGALRTCAGSALLRDPEGLGRVVACVVEATTKVPVTAKIRAGYDDDSLLEELCLAAQENGAALLSVHCRTRLEGYRDVEDWNRVVRCVETLTIPVCGNGGVWKHADLERMRRETGCDLVMVGRAALGNPWIFGGREVDRAEAALFLIEYADLLEERKGMSSRAIAGRLKQLLRVWTAGGLTEEDPKSWLHEKDGARLRARLQEFAGELRAPGH